MLYHLVQSSKEVYQQLGRMMDDFKLNNAASVARMKRSEIRDSMPPSIYDWSRGYTTFHPGYNYNYVQNDNAPPFPSAVGSE